LSKLAEDVLRVEFSDPKISSAAECYGACVAKGFPKPVRMFYRGSRSRASNRFSGDDAIIRVIERHDHELDNLGHVSPPLARFQTAFSPLFI
jgi:hypothetical protein